MPYSDAAFLSAVLVYGLIGLVGLVVLSLFMRWFLGISRIIGLLERIANKLDPRSAGDKQPGLLERGIGKVIDATQAKKE